MAAHGSRHSWIVTLLDDDSAALEIDGRAITSLPRWMLPAGAREGDVLTVLHERKRRGSRLTIVIDRERTAVSHQQSEEDASTDGKGGSAAG
jgi:hypothetical protein